ncbi:hypothetical protein J2Z62_000677 [Mycoplasmoides fastidiosum]|uniref:DUF31 domain-containing protein n=1 Tax=Mycoplasmoides fastidiosum TaxID=92758 RepID=A0ABU0LZV7_9BACT|nr:hypothetical protein [Mycoplasmoides fastidiosum]MDQ0514239.1 hypothetical protein [Mycoplasmoides fastidiosum]UUD37353.1 hypothetical protein NPA10_02090 [Mycoplasmoides fastidiosum]
MIYGEPSTEYSHYVLGKQHNFKKLFYIERHNMNDNLADPLILENHNVFEGDVFNLLSYNNKNYLVTTTANAEQGAQLNLVGLATNSFRNNKFQIFASSQPIGMGQRWISAFVINNELYANKTPHINGGLYKYSLPDLKQETKIVDGISLHKIGETTAAVYGYLDQQLFVRTTNYQTLRIINLTNPTQILEHNFQQEIKQILSGPKSVFVRLNDNSVYEIQNINNKKEQ